MDDLVRESYYSEDISRHGTHYHDCHQILFIRKGQITVTIQGQTHKAGAGDILIFSRYEDHSVEVLSEEYARFVLRVSPTVHRSKLYSLLANRPFGFRNIVNVTDQKAVFDTLFCRITEEFQSGDALSGQMLELLVGELLLRLYRRLPTAYMEDGAFEIVYRLQKRFEEHCEEDYTLEGLAKEYGVSVSLLSHEFKRITGTPVMAYLCSCRMAEAKNLLTRTRLSVGEITQRCGFSDGSNFSRIFKKRYGITPSQFRKKYGVVSC